MGLPSINIVFQEAARTVADRAQKGIVAMILKDSTKDVQGAHTFRTVADIPEKMTATNKAYIEQAFVGAENKPSKIYCFVLATTAEDLTAATDWLSGLRFNWLVGYPGITSEEVDVLADWIVAQRKAGRHYKAVLPHKKANNSAIVNLTTDDIKIDKENIYNAAGFCARIAGLIAGKPLTSSVTFAPLFEVASVKQLSRKEMDDAIEAGELILMHDGQKVKIGRGVTSLATPAPGESDIYKKIKIVETLDLISEDLTTLGEDNYIGKYTNSYDNKLLLTTAIKGYFETLEREGNLKTGSTVNIDTVAVEKYLKGKGVDTTEMSEQDLREADTGDSVFLVITIKVLDAIEDISLVIYI